MSSLRKALGLSRFVGVDRFGNRYYEKGLRRSVKPITGSDSSAYDPSRIDRTIQALSPYESSSVEIVALEDAQQPTEQGRIKTTVYCGILLVSPFVHPLAMNRARTRWVVREWSSFQLNQLRGPPIADHL